MTRHLVHVARVYDDETPTGTRVLVDRLWPRGLSRDRAALSLWLREIAPSDELRHWYGHRPELFDEFRGRYLTELETPERQVALGTLRTMRADAPLLLLTATTDPGLSQAEVLAELLRGSSIGPSAGYRRTGLADPGQRG